MTTRTGRRVALPILQGTIAVGAGRDRARPVGQPAGRRAGDAAARPRARRTGRSGRAPSSRPASPSRSRASPPTAPSCRACSRSARPASPPRRSSPPPTRSSPRCSEPQRTKTAVRGRRPGVAQVDEPALLRAPGRRLQRDERGAARGRVRPAARVAEREGPEADARHHAPEPHARRAEQQRLRRVRRVALLHHGDGHAVGDRALGLAARRPPRDHQLLRAGRSGGDDADLRRLGAGDRDVRQVRRHVGPAGRAGPRPGVHEQRSTPPQRAKAIVAPTKTGNNNLTEAFKDNVVLDYAGVKASELPAAAQSALADLDRPVRRQHGRRAREGEDGGGEAAPRRHVVRLGRRDRRRTRSSTTASTAR